MAQNTPHQPAPVHGRPKVNIKEEGLLTLGFFAGSFALIFLFNRVLGFSQIASVTVSVLAAGCAVFAAFRSMMKSRWEAENADAQKTVVPIIERYTATRSPKILMNDYEAWCEGEHDVDLQLQFLQIIVEALANDGHPKEARKMLAQMERVSQQAGAQENFKLYKADVEARLG